MDWLFAFSPGLQRQSEQAIWLSLLPIALGHAASLALVAVLLVMALGAWFVYRCFGLAILRQKWVNFDLIWAVALLVVGSLALARGMAIL